MAQVNVYNLSGGNGSLYINDIAAHTGEFFAVQCTEATVFAELAGNVEDKAALITDSTSFAAGTVIYGRFTRVDLNSGAVIAYKGS